MKKQLIKQQNQLLKYSDGLKNKEGAAAAFIASEQLDNANKTQRVETDSAEIQAEDQGWVTPAVFSPPQTSIGQVEIPVEHI